MWELLQTLIVCGTMVYVLLRAEKFAFAWYDRLHSTKIIVPEQEVEERAPIPPDLLNLCLQESEQWAREGALKAMQDMYDRTGDWNVVRAAYQITPDVVE